MQMRFDSSAFQLILSCCRQKQSTFDKERRNSAILKGIDAEELTILAERHRITPLVYLLLKDELNLYPGLLLELKDRFDRNRFMALTLKSYETWLENYLSQHNIKFTFLKGLQIAEKYYGDIASRHVLDIDILVESGGINQLHQALLEQGFYPDPDIGNFNRSQLSFFRAVNHDLAYIKKSQHFNVVIEVHWRFRGQLKGFSVDEVRTLDKVEELLYLCTHGTEHAWFRLKWLCDILQMIDAVSFNWDAVRQRAQELDCITHLELTWLLIRQLFSIPIPPPILNGMPASMHRSKMEHICNSIQRLSGVNQDDSMRFNHLVYTLGFQKRLAGLPLVCKYLTGPKDWKLLPLPHFLFFLYFPLRPFLFLWRKLTVRSIALV
jgi:hypothetical protein